MGDGRYEGGEALGQGGLVSIESEAEVLKDIIRARQYSDGAKGGGNGGGVTAPKFCVFGLEFSQMFWAGGVSMFLGLYSTNRKTPRCQSSERWSH